MLIQIEKNLKLVVLPAVFALIMSTGNLANATWVHHDGNSHRQTDQGNRHHIWPRPRPIIRPINPVEGDSANPVTGPIEPTFSRLLKTKNNIGNKMNQKIAKSAFVYQ
jgi:hypothetical protein